MSRISGELLHGPRSHVLLRVLRSAGQWLVLGAVVDIGLGVLVGSSMWWLNWRRPPTGDFFVTLAGIGGALLIAYSVTVTQVFPGLVRHAARSDTALTMDVFGRVLGFALAVAFGGVIGLSTCLALVHDSLTRSQWLAMSLFGVSVFTAAVLALAVGLGTLIYVLLFVYESLRADEPVSDGLPGS
jgi:hypothetical protein